MTKLKANSSEFLLQNVSFLKSTTNPRNFPSSEIPEIAIVGRSNAGKSSVLNTLCKRKQLAYTSKTPGKTQLINFFSIIGKETEIARIIDLPGYGYAKVDKSTKNFWNSSLLKFLLERENLVGIILVTDLRHPLGKLDQNLFLSVCHRSLYFHLLFNKSDKLKKLKQTQNLNKAIQDFFNNMPKSSKKVSYSTFSSTKKIGIDELSSVLDSWLVQNSIHSNHLS